MSKYLFSLVFASVGLCLTGCQSSPGFRFGFEVQLPPTLRQTNALNPLPTAMSTTYAVEGVADVPVVQRQYQVAPAPVPRRVITPVPAQQLPMPRETVPGSCVPGNGCGNGGGAE